MDTIRSSTADARLIFGGWGRKLFARWCPSISPIIWHRGPRNVDRATCTSVAALTAFTSHGRGHRLAC